MASVGCCGSWMVFTGGARLVGVHRKESREAFVFDCSTAERNPKRTKDNKHSDNGSSEDAGSDRILAMASSPSGELLALTDDSKRLVLLRCRPSWSCISIRWVVRRCVSMSFSATEQELLVADKAGDVYSFSVTAPQQEGELRMGHLSMLLAVTVSSDNRFIITADRDEKIRVSHLSSPYCIQSFCLGHREFVSFLHVPSGHPQWLLSGSGVRPICAQLERCQSDGTVKLWECDSGRRLQSCDLRGSDGAQDSEVKTEKNVTVSRICSSPDGRHVAVQCDNASTVEMFTLDHRGEEKLLPHSRLTPPHCPVDVTFDPDGQLWVLMASHDAPLLIYRHRQSSWECQPDSEECTRVSAGLRAHWEPQDACVRPSSRFSELHRASFDNVGVYLQKKQQRLEEQQEKRARRADAQ